VKKNK